MGLQNSKHNLLSLHKCLYIIPTISMKLQQIFLLDKVYIGIYIEILLSSDVISQNLSAVQKASFKSKSKWYRFCTETELIDFKTKLRIWHKTTVHWFQETISRISNRASHRSLNWDFEKLIIPPYSLLSMQLRYVMFTDQSQICSTEKC